MTVVATVADRDLAPATGRSARRRVRSQSARERACLYAFAVGAAGAVAIWWFNARGQPLHDAASQVTAVGRITGLLATYLILVQLLLVARLRPLDRWIGMDRLAVWHRRNGQYAVLASVVHTATIVWGYASQDRLSIATETERLLRSYPGMLEATVALGLLLLVSATSVRRAMRNLRRETWYFIHLYTYLAVWLSFSHQVKAGHEFELSHSAQLGWTAAHLVVAGSLIAYRVLQPGWDAVRHDLRVLDVRDENSEVVSVYVTGKRMAQVRGEPGQFFIWRFLTREHWWKAHPFSLSAAPNGDVLRFTAKACGDHTSELRHLAANTPVVAEGPYGNLTGGRRTRRRVLLIAGGIGITPLRALFESLEGEPGDITLLYRVRSLDDRLFHDELEEIAATRGFDVHYLVGRPSGEEPLSPQSLVELVPDVASRDIFICGPPGMLETVEESLSVLEVSPDQVHSERFEL